MEKKENKNIKIDDVKDNNKFKPTSGDLKVLMKDFAKNQKHYLNIEREEEEKQTLDNIFNYSARVNLNFNGRN